MSYEIIEEGISKINNITSWNVYLINYDHNKKPNEYQCYDINFTSNDLLKETVTDMGNKFLSLINKKYDKKILDYTGENPKNIVDKLSISHDIISSNWNFLMNSINNSDDSSSLSNIKSKAYIFLGSYDTENDATKKENIYLIACKNPVITYNKKRAPIFLTKNNIIEKSKEPLISFNRVFDALVYKNKIYMINTNCEKIFNMEETHKKICKKYLNQLENTNIIKDFAIYKTFATSGQIPKKFMTYDASLVEKLKNIENRNLLCEKLRIPLSADSQFFDLDKKINAKNFTSAICGKIKINIFDNDICEVSNSHPLSFN